MFVCLFVFQGTVNPFVRAEHTALRQKALPQYKSSHLYEQKTLLQLQYTNRNISLSGSCQCKQIYCTSSNTAFQCNLKVKFQNMTLDVFGKKKQLLLISKEVSTRNLITIIFWIFFLFNHTARERENLLLLILQTFKQRQA